MKEVKAVQIVVCTDINGGIGFDGKLLYRINDDLRRFARITTDTTLVMGRKTFESLPKILPGRKHIVITEKAPHEIEWPEGTISQVTLVNTFDKAMVGAELADAERGISIIGGGTVYRQALDAGVVNTIQATIVMNEDRERDTTFPFKVLAYPETYGFQQVYTDKSNRTNEYLEYRFATYHRIGYGRAEEVDALVSECGTFIKIKQSTENGKCIRIRRDAVHCYGPAGDVMLNVLLAHGSDITVRCADRKERDQMLSELDSLYLAAVLP